MLELANLYANTKGNTWKCSQHVWLIAQASLLRFYYIRMLSLKSGWNLGEVWLNRGEVGVNRFVFKSGVRSFIRSFVRSFIVCCCVLCVVVVVVIVVMVVGVVVVVVVVRRSFRHSFVRSGIHLSFIRRSLIRSFVRSVIHSCVDTLLMSFFASCQVVDFVIL